MSCPPASFARSSAAGCPVCCQCWSTAAAAATVVVVVVFTGFGSIVIFVYAGIMLLVLLMLFEPQIRLAGELKLHLCGELGSNAVCCGEKRRAQGAARWVEEGEGW